MAYHFQRDKVQILCKGDGYLIRMTKVVRAVGHPPVEFIYARIDVSVVPDSPQIAASYYRDNPITLENLRFRVSDYAGGLLRYNVLHQYPSNIELALLLHRTDEDLPRPLGSGETARVRYTFEPTNLQWGHWLEREVRVPTDFLVVSLLFPRDLVTCSAAEVVGGSKRPLPGGLIHRQSPKFDWWYWELDDPSVHHRFRFTWAYKDGREKRIMDQVRRAYGGCAPDTFGLSVDARSARWFGHTLTFSPTQAMVMQYLVNSTTRIRKISEQDVLTEVESRSTRLRDVFKAHPAWGTLVVAKRGFVSLDYSAAAYRRYVSAVSREGMDD